MTDTTPRTSPTTEAGPEYGRVFGQIMQAHPDADARLVNDILRLAWAEARQQGRPSVEDIRWAVNGHHEGSWDAEDPACSYYLGGNCSCDYEAAMERLNKWLDEQVAALSPEPPQEPQR